MGIPLPKQAIGAQAAQRPKAGGRNPIPAGTRGPQSYSRPGPEAPETDFATST